MADQPFGFDTPEDSPGFLLWQTTTVWQRRIKKALEAHAISHAQFVVLALALWLSEHQQAPTQTRIIQLSKLDKMTVSKSLKQLALGGYIERAEHATDTRAKIARPTAQGAALLHRLVPAIEQMDAEFFGALSQPHQRTLTSLLGQLAKHSAE